MSQRSTRILLIDDDRNDFLVTQNSIGRINGSKFLLDWAPTYEDALAAFERKNHHLYMIDYCFGNNGGMQVMAKAKTMGIDAPFIFLSAPGARLIEDKIRNSGVADFLDKDTISTEQLERSIRYCLKEAKSVKKILSLGKRFEKRILERTRNLENMLIDLHTSKENLIRSLDQEKKLNELKSSFVSMTSHEFRTPLATILSSLTLLQNYSGNCDEKVMKHIGRIKSSVIGMTNLLDDILSLSKLEEGIQTSLPDVINLSLFVSNIALEMQDLMKKGQQMIYEEEQEKILVSADKKILKNILLNLVSNAIKYSPEGKNIYVTTGLRNDAPFIEVKDNGIGISEKDQKRLFQRFFRGSNATDIQGTGLGLSIVAKYLEVLNGKISFTSELGSGTTFTIVLPPTELIHNHDH